MKRFFIPLVLAGGVLAAVGVVATAQQAPPTGGQLVLFSDLALFAGPGKPENCFLKNRFKHGDPVGFRIRVLDGGTGQPESSAEVVVHLTYGGQTVDVPARYRDTAGTNPAQRFWTAKWIVPADAPTGVLGYAVTARDKHGRTGDFHEFPNQAAQLTIVE